MHTSGIQVAPIEHKGEARLALVFPYEKQRVARVRSLPGARWSQSRKCWHVPATEAAAQLLSDRLPDLIVLPDSSKPASGAGLSSEASDNAGINTHSTAAKGRLWHKVDITPAHEAGRAQVSLTGGKLTARSLYDVAMYPSQSAADLKNLQFSRPAVVRKARQKWGECADITKLPPMLKRQRQWTK